MRARAVSGHARVACAAGADKGSAGDRGGPWGPVGPVPGLYLASRPPTQRSCPPTPRHVTLPWRHADHPTLRALHCPWSQALPSRGGASPLGVFPWLWPAPSRVLRPSRCGQEGDPCDGCQTPENGDWRFQPGRDGEGGAEGQLSVSPLGRVTPGTRGRPGPGACQGSSAGPRATPERGADRSCSVHLGPGTGRPAGRQAGGRTGGRAVCAPTGATGPRPTSPGPDRPWEDESLCGAAWHQVERAEADGGVIFLPLGPERASGLGA